MYMVVDKNSEISPACACIRFYSSLSDAFNGMRETIDKAEKEGFSHDDFRFYADESDYLISIYFWKKIKKESHTYVSSIIEIKDNARHFI